ncbi:hypothetical protein LMH87_012007 [Akanthomyces muscarius]|uniref:Uncharacterized protein n=1 Tax=Akanthomyces muscarius TaxID=2231603 RepID=A0A9W8UKH2_AKAMU|nr:hypothetical protein LMH87_012007 [Akanthomyces muscarius]KAJ4151297.1 hypothetical protein LMH87_012007 [Akanthomyces muscarius]
MHTIPGYNLPVTLGKLCLPAHNSHKTTIPEKLEQSAHEDPNVDDIADFLIKAPGLLLSEQLNYTPSLALSEQDWDKLEQVVVVQCVCRHSLADIILTLSLV